MSKPSGSALMEKIVALCKRRGFVYPASDIYGGINGFWDFGPLGTQLKNNLRDAWWRDMVECPPIGPDGVPLQIVGVDSAIIQNPRAWEASGHVGGFNDPMVDCRESKRRYRADHLLVYMHEGEKPFFAFLEGEEASVAKKLQKSGLSPEQCQVTSLLDIDQAHYARIVGPDTTETGTLTAPRQFNLMFKTFVGATGGEDDVAISARRQLKASS